MIDSHCHLQSNQFKSDVEDVIKRAFDEGVQAIVVPAIHPGDFDDVLNIARRHKNIYCGLGIHPHHAHEVKDGDLHRLEDLLSEDGVVAVGEVGMDYYYDFCPPDIQKGVLAEQCAIAEKANLPLIIHDREATADLYAVMEQWAGKVQGVFHCFSGSPDDVQRALAMGFHVSFTGNITFKQSTLADTVRAAHPNKVMIETDSPYLTAVPHRGKRNEPHLVSLVAHKIAELTQKPFEEVVQMTTDNAKRFFKLSLPALLLCAAASTGFAEGPADNIAKVNASLRQERDTTEADYEEEEEYEEEEVADRGTAKYRKIGIAPVFGTNTIVESPGKVISARYVPNDVVPPGWKEEYVSLLPGSRGDISYDGVVAIGGAVNWYFTDHFSLQAMYSYAKNNVLVERNIALNPRTHQLIDASVIYTPNPSSLVNFLFSGGFSHFKNFEEGNIDESFIGWNLGIGFAINIKTSFGMIVPTLEWRFSNIIGERKITYGSFETPPGETAPRWVGTETLRVNDGGTTYSYNLQVERNTSLLFSIPKLQLYWYPSL